MKALLAALCFSSCLVHAADGELKLQIMICESGLKYDAIGDGGPSRGISQFKRATFYEFAAITIRRKLWDFKLLGKPQWMNPQQQLFLLDWGLDNGYANRWGCYRKFVLEGKITASGTYAR